MRFEVAWESLLLRPPAPAPDLSRSSCPHLLSREASFPQSPQASPGSSTSAPPPIRVVGRPNNLGPQSWRHAGTATPHPTSLPQASPHPLPSQLRPPCGQGLRATT